MFPMKVRRKASTLTPVPTFTPAPPPGGLAEAGLPRVEPDHSLPRLPQDPASLDREVARAVHNRYAGALRAVPDPDSVVQGVEREERSERVLHGIRQDRFDPRGGEG